MTKTGRAVLLTMLLAAVAVTAAVSTGPSLAGKKEGRAILDRSAAFYAQLQSARVTMEVRVEMPEGLLDIPDSGPERYAIAMARPRSLSLIPTGDHPGASFIQNDEQAYGELPTFQRYVLADATPFDQWTGEAGNEALVIPGSNVLRGLAAGSEGSSFALFAGTAKLVGDDAVEGVDCHRLSLKGPDGHAELWIAKGERPWLIRHRTEAPEAPKMPDKDESGTMVISFMPGFDIRFADWEADPDLAGAFEIRPREGFTQAETLYPPPEEMAALMGSMGGPGGFGADHPSVGKPAPEVSIEPLDGEAVALSSMKGKVVVLDFWASWCQPCVIELPLVDKVTDERADKGVVFYAVNTGESEKSVTKFLKSRDLDVPLVLDDDGVIASAYGVGALPHLVVIDSQGTVRHVHLGSGPGTEQRLETELDALLSE